MSYYLFTRKNYKQKYCSYVFHEGVNIRYDGFELISSDTDTCAKYLVSEMTVHNIVWDAKPQNILSSSKYGCICDAVILSNPRSTKTLFDNETEEKIIELIDYGEVMIRYTTKRTPVICMKLVTVSPSCIQYLTEGEQTPEVCLKAVSRKYIDALKYIINQTPEICLQAVRVNPKSLQYVKNQRQDIIEEALKVDPTVVKYVRDENIDIIVENSIHICKTKNEVNIYSDRDLSFGNVKLE